MSEAGLQSVFVNALGLPADTAFETLTYRGIPQWDSLAHMVLISELETTFDIMLETDDVLDLSSYQKAKEILAKYGVNP